MKTKTPKNLEDAFDKAILAKAGKIIRGYRIIIEENANLGFIGNSVELPTVFADGKTPEECYNAVQEALTGTVATMIVCKRKPPQSSLAEKRTEQINIRLTPYEKLLLTNKSATLGFKGLSDLIRNFTIDNLLKTS